MIRARLSSVKAPICSGFTSLSITFRTPPRLPLIHGIKRSGLSLFASPSLTSSSVPSGVRAMSTAMKDMVLSKNKENDVVVYSKTYCPYCSEVSSLFNKLKVPAKVIQLDELADGDAVQDALTEVTGRRTVPQVFIGGQHVGGCDDTMAAYNSGKLKTLLASVGISI